MQVTALKQALCSRSSIGSNFACKSRMFVAVVLLGNRGSERIYELILVY
jgi:hypothetical protein